MPNITYIEFDGKQRTVNVPVGWSVKDGALNNGIGGIVADCGGSCVCATCQVFIDQDWQPVVGGPSTMERALLEMSNNTGPNRRLSCQIKVTDALEGMVVRTPEQQG